MGTVLYFCILTSISFNAAVDSDVYSVNILTEHHVNLVDSRFLSFTLDPKNLFLSSEKYSSKECVCMASALTPAYLRIAGPSTTHMSFHNTTISLNSIDLDVEEKDLEIAVLDADEPKKDAKHSVSLEVTHREWRRFIHWAKSTGFDLVFALNNEEKTPSGMWDPNTALNILSVAEKAKVGEMYWELGYECKNQSIEEYLNDLETLRVIIETFPPGRTGDWKAVGGDVSRCLQADSKTDFKDYIVLSNDMMDALLLNGNSSTRELEHMSDLNRLRLLRLLAHSKTPLWLTESIQKRYNQLERAADWLASLGYAAKNGFSVHYRELDEEEMYEPTLSFYMALLFKNLVGDRVLELEMEPKQAVIFGHCTSLRQKPVPGAVTLFGVNMNEEPAKFSLKFSKREEGGDVMQFILGYDHSGNIIVNGRPMYYEGDIKPVVKQVRPFKTLLITLPAKSFGFWVLANTKINACQDLNGNNKTTTESTIESLKVKRSIDDDLENDEIANLSYQDGDSEVFNINNKGLTNHVTDINKDIHEVHQIFNNNIVRFKRQGEDTFGKIKSRIQSIKPRFSTSNFDFNPRDILHNILQKARQSVDVLRNKGSRGVRRFLNKSKISKRHSRNYRAGALKKPMRTFGGTFERASGRRAVVNKIPKRVISLQKIRTPKKVQSLNKGIKLNQKSMNIVEEKSNKKPTTENKILGDEKNLKPMDRRRRQATSETEELLTINDLYSNEKNKSKFWKILKNLHEDLSEEVEYDENNESMEGIVLKTQLSDDTATIKVKESGKGLIKSTMNNVVSVLEDLNRNLNRVWGALTTLD